MPSLTLDAPSAQAEGRLWAVRLVPGASAPEPTENPLDEGPGWVWIHFDLVNANARQGLLRCALPAPVAAMFSEVDETPRLLAEEGWLAGVLITGFFGMNTGGLPWTQTAHGTVLAVGLLSSAVGLMLWLLRRNGML